MTAHPAHLADLIAHWADTTPAKPFVVFDDGAAQWTYAELASRTWSTGHALRALGVEQGDRVVSWMPNGPTALRMWFGANSIGSVVVPVNTAYRGAILEHALTIAAPRLAVVHADLLHRLCDVSSGVLPDLIVVVGSDEQACARLRTHAPHCTVLDDSALVSAESSRPVTSAPLRASDAYGIIFTSGTTGPSKGAVCTHAQLHCWADWAAELCTPDDRFLVELPLFHGGGTLPTYAMLRIGASIAMTPSFSSRDYWRMARERGVTVVLLVGVMAQFLLNQPVRDDETDNPVRLVWMSPLVDDVAGFAQRFGVEVRTSYNMTEVARPVQSGANPAEMGTGYAGEMREPFEVRLVDEYDEEVPVGSTGQLIVRSNVPWVISSEYAGMPAESLKAWRNGWFHTGDLFRVTAEGGYYFVDRVTDSLRRRGENVSSAEVEKEIVGFPGVTAAAVVGVPSEDGEQEILAVLEVTDPAAFDRDGLISHLRNRLPYFMVPRYLRLLLEMPRTPTNKIIKADLRSAGVTPDVWDRSRHGHELKRERLNDPSLGAPDPTTSVRTP